MTELAIALVGLLVGAALGGVAAWMLASARVRSQMGTGHAALQNRLGAAEASASELRAQLQARDDEVKKLRFDLQEEQHTRIASETRQTEIQKAIEAQQKQFAEIEARLRDTFTTLSTDALRRNNEEFARQAGEKVQPLSEALKRFEAQIRELEQARQGAYGRVSQALDQIGLAHRQLTQQTGNLVTALRSPQVRGRWGEITLQRAVEVAGMSAHCDFTPQMSLASEDGRLRPDLVVHLPGGRSLVVDAKAPLAAYLDAIEAGDAEQRTEHLKRHAKAIRARVRELATKSYAAQFNPAPDFVVLFLPGESFFSAALEHDRELIEDGMASGVILATPTTLIALLRTVAFSWQQRELVDNAQRIGAVAAELYERVCRFADHLGNVGRGLQRATEAYNQSVASWEARVLPMERRLAELRAVASAAEPAAPQFVDKTPRSLDEQRLVLAPRGEASHDSAAASHSGSGQAG